MKDLFSLQRGEVVHLGSLASQPISGLVASDGCEVLGALGLLLTPVGLRLKEGKPTIRDITRNITKEMDIE
eukprot:5722906-Pyramimonas_sp.AAC.1